MAGMPGDTKTRRRSLSLATHLFAFTLAVAGPIVALAFFALSESIEIQRASIRDALAAHAHSLSNLVASRVDDFFIASRTLARSQPLAEGDYKRFNAQAESIRASVAIMGVEVIGDDGKVLSRTPDIAADTDFPPPNAVASESLSDVIAGGPKGLPIVRVNVPLETAGAISMIAAASEFQKLLEKQDYDETWIVSVLDSGMNFVARLPKTGNVGAPAGADWRAALAEHRDGLARITTIEGERTLIAYRQTTHGWTVGIAAPLRLLDEQAQAGRLQFAVTTLLSLLASLVIAAMVGRRLAAKAAVIEQAARNLALDREVPDQTTGIMEYDKLVASLRDSAKLLSRRKSERDTFEQSQILSGRMLQAALNVAEIAIYEWDPGSDSVQCGSQFKKMWGLDGEGPIYSRQLMRRVAVEDREKVRRAILGALDGNGDGLFSVEFRIVSPDGGAERWLYCRSQTEFENRRAVRVIGAARDITDRRQRGAELESQRQELRTLANAMPQLVWVADGTGEILYFNENRSLYRNGSSGLLDWRSMVYPDDLPGMTSEWRRALETGDPFSYEHRLILTDGSLAWHLSRSLPTRNARGEIVRWHGTATNIHEHKLREEHIRVLLAEVNHRSKNLLAVLQAIVRQTARSTDSVLEFAENFNARVKALATSQELLTAQNWQGVSMHDLVKLQLDHYAELFAARIHISGPEALLGPEAAQSLGMALHELSTNAAKYGALSNREGEVEINWAFERRDGDEFLVVRWSEKGGPAAREPAHKGFGSFVVDRMLSSRFGAQVKLSYPEDGLKWKFIAPARNVIAVSKHRSAASGGLYEI